MKKKIGILGSGQVSQTLAAGLTKHGYEVMIGSRYTSKLTEWQKKNNKVQLGSFEDAARFGEAMVVAVKGTAAEDLVKSLASHLVGKTIMDTTNPIADAPPENGVLRYFTGIDDSLMERFQRAVPGGNFVKVFSSVGSPLMVNPDFPSGRATMFICGNHAGAKKDVSRLLDQFGWDTEDMGNVEAARAIEPLCMLWCIPGFLNNQWKHAFKLVKM